MSYSNVLKFLHSELTRQAKSDSLEIDINKFISELQSRETEKAKRLIVCLGIDLKNSLNALKKGYLKQNTYVSHLIDCISATMNTPLPHQTFKRFKGNIPVEIRFAVAKNRISPNPHFPLIKDSEPASYARIYNFDSYMEYVIGLQANKSPDILDYNPDYTEYLYEFMHYDLYRSTEVTTLGIQGRWMFVGDYNEFKIRGDQKAQELVDALGFYMSETNKDDYYICLKYPENFDQECYLPDSFTGDWGSLNHDGSDFNDGNSFFMTYPNFDTWGRTYSVSGTKKGMKERVHETFDMNGSRYYSMEAENVGDLPDDLEIGDSLELLTEALSRFDEN